MLDTYREMEQAGNRVRVRADHVEVEYPSGGRWLHYADHREYHGPRVLCVEIRECETSGRGCLVFLWSLLRRQR
jgi:hypothetical protein